MLSALMPKPPVPAVPKVVDNAFVQTHAAAQQEDDFYDRQAHVKRVKDAGGVLRLRHQLVDNGAGHFRFENVNGAVRRLGQHDDKDQNAHAAHPMGEAAPEQQAPAHGLHIRQDGGAGGGKAADGFKQSVYIGGDLPGKNEGQRTDGGQKQPRQRHDDKPVPDGGATPRAAAGKLHHKANCQRNGNGVNKADGTRLPIQQRNQKRQHQKPCFHKNHAAYRVEIIFRFIKTALLPAERAQKGERSACIANHTPDQGICQKIKRKRLAIEKFSCYTE